MKPRTHFWLICVSLILNACSAFSPDMGDPPPPEPTKVVPGEEEPLNVTIEGENFIIKVARRLDRKKEFIIDDRFIAQLKLENTQPLTHFTKKLKKVKFKN